MRDFAAELDASGRMPWTSKNVWHVGIIHALYLLRVESWKHFFRLPPQALWMQVYPFRFQCFPRLRQHINLIAYRHTFPLSLCSVSRQRAL